MDPEALLNLTFSPQLESALAEVLPSDDPLDAADFDPVAYMNAKFPTEESLGSIDAFCDELDARSKALNEEILQTVRALSTAEGFETDFGIGSAFGAFIEMSQKQVGLVVARCDG